MVAHERAAPLGLLLRSRALLVFKPSAGNTPVAALSLSLSLPLSLSLSFSLFLSLSLSLSLSAAASF